MNEELERIKNSLLTELEKRVSDKILERSNANLLGKLISNAESINEAISIAQLGTTYKKTGLHYDKRLEKQTNEIKYFKKNEELSFSDGIESIPHKLIIGDNYDALRNLLIQYRGLVDVVYIDPPYGKDSMGEFAKTNYTNSISRDNLLSMLYPRLKLAKELLSMTGAIFCSIDDKNQAFVKCLMDEVFGEANFMGNIIWRKKSGGGQTDDFFVKEHEYILSYRRTDAFKWLDFNEEANESKFKYNANDGKGNYGITKLEKWGSAAHREDRPTMCFPIKDPDNNDFLPIAPDKLPGRWRVGAKRMQRLIDNDEIHWEKDEEANRWIPYEKNYYSGAKGKLLKCRSIFYNVAETGTATKLLTSIFNKKDSFDNPKPIEVLKRIFEHMQNDLIVDFFAGSGSTGHAILDMNLDDENRKFILCQSNEITDKNPHGIALDITAPRLKRIMTGSCYNWSNKYPFYSGSNDFPWLNDNEIYGGSLDVYELENVSDSEHIAGQTAFDVIDETLYGKAKFEKLEDKIQWICEHFEVTEKSIESDKEWIKRVENN